MTESIQKEDWERFRVQGEVPPGIREIVLGSWLRSQEDNRIVARTQAPSLAPDDVPLLRERNARLHRAARTVLGRGGEMLEDGGAILVLCDGDGVVMETAGDRRVLARGRENCLHPGGRWDEQAIGTNAIGTALHLARPVAIAGAEHFCEAIQRWSCAAAPVRCPTSGKVLGAVDISGPWGELSGPVTTLSMTLALQIEEAMRSAEQREARVLLETLLERGAPGGGDAQMLFDGRGRMIWASPPLRAALQERDGPAEALRHLAAAGEGDAGQIAARMRAALPEAGVDLLEAPGAARGVLVWLHRARPRGQRLAATAPEVGPVTLAEIAAGGPQLAELCARAARLHAAPVPLLIAGAPGSGKETLAAALHAAGPLAGRPFEVLDCGLLDAAMLGEDPPGRLARLAAQGGTLCLDTPEATPPALQPALAQWLAAQARRDGPELRLIVLTTLPRAAQAPLAPALQARLSGARIALPALVERRADIPGLLRRLAARGAPSERPGRGLRFSARAMARLQAHDWPGNLHEMRSLVTLLAATPRSRPVDLADLPAEIGAPAAPRQEDTLRQGERAAIVQALEESGGNRAAAARRLGISRSTLYLKLDQYGLPRGRRG